MWGYLSDTFDPAGDLVFMSHDHELNRPPTLMRWRSETSRAGSVRDLWTPNPDRELEGKIIIITPVMWPIIRIRQGYPSSSQQEEGHREENLWGPVDQMLQVHVGDPPVSANETSRPMVGHSSTEYMEDDEVTTSPPLHRGRKGRWQLLTLSFGFLKCHIPISCDIMFCSLHWDQDESTWNDYTFPPGPLRMSLHQRKSSAHVDVHSCVHTHVCMETSVCAQCVCTVH